LSTIETNQKNQTKLKLIFLSDKGTTDYICPGKTLLLSDKGPYDYICPDGNN